MDKYKKEINAGGVNGSGKGIVNTNSKEYKALQQAIIEHSKTLSHSDKIRYDLVALKYQMQKYVSLAEPKLFKEAGEFLKEHLKAIGIKNKEFAKYINIEESNLSAILRSKRKINIDFALKLGEVFSVNPNIWLLIQSKNELLSVDKEKKLTYRKYKLDDLLKKVR